MKTIRSLVICCILAALLVSCNHTEPHPEVRGSQPSLELVLQPSSAAAGEVARVIATAKSFWTPPDAFWPEPSSVSEQDTFWIVWFEKKEKSVMRDGKLVVIKTRPNGQGIRVNKPDFSCQMMPSR